MPAAKRSAARSTSVGVEVHRMLYLYEIGLAVSSGTMAVLGYLLWTIKR